MEQVNNLRSWNEIARTVDVVKQIVNTRGAGQGTSVPPRLIGSSQVPTIKGLEITPLGNSYLGTEFLLTWEDLPREFNVDRYNIYARREGEDEQPRLVASVSNSPARVRVSGTATAPAVFQIQTQLYSGYSSPLEESPSASGIATQAQISDPDILSVSLGKLLAGEAVFTGDAIFRNGNYRLRIQADNIQMNDGTNSVEITSGGNIVLTRGGRVLTLSGAVIRMDSGGGFVEINSTGIITLQKDSERRMILDGTQLRLFNVNTNLTIDTNAISMSDGTNSVAINASGHVVLTRGSRVFTLSGSAASLVDGTNTLEMDATRLRLARGSFRIDLDAAGITLTDGTRSMVISASQQIMSGGQLILNGTSGTDPFIVQTGSTNRMRVDSVGDISFSTNIQFSGAHVVQHGDGFSTFRFTSSGSGFDVFLPVHVVNGSDAYRHNSNTGITGTRTALDSGSVSRTVTISGGIITGWTT